jgi:phage terminase large subunit
MSGPPPDSRKRIRFRWQPKQDQLLDLVERSPASWIGFGGARGGSKSHAGRQIILDRRIRYAGTDALVIRRTFKEVFGNCIQPMFRAWPITRKWYRGASATEGHHVLALPNGSKVFYGYAEHKEDIYDWQGWEFADILVEEASHFNEEELRFLKTCNRWTSSAPIHPKFICTMNPGNVGHDFMRRIFVDRRYSENEKPEDYAFIQAYGWDNLEWSLPSLLTDNGITAESWHELTPSQQDEVREELARIYYGWTDRERFEYFVTRSDYGRNLFALPSQERDAHLFGEWDSFIGQFFSEFQRRLHVCKPFQIPSYWERFASFDWGFRSPACTLWHAVSPEGRVYTYREAYVKGKDTPWLAQNNVKLTGNETLRYKVGDPACFNNTAGGPTVAEVMAINGWAMLTAENDRKNGWARVRDYLAWEENDQGQLTREPTWQIFDGPGAPQGLGCPNLIRTLPALVHDPYDPEDVNSDCEDHAPDTARYGLMTRPRSTIVPLAVMDYEYREATQRAEHDEGRSNSSSGSFYSD